MRKYILFVLFLSCLYSCTNKKDEWVDLPKKIKYSKSKEVEVWGKVLLGYHPEIYYGTPVYEAALAISHKDSKKLKAFFEKHDKALLNDQSGKFKMPLNAFAIFTGDFESLKVLTELGADPNLQDNSGMSAMLRACFKSNRDNRFLKYLVENGGDVNAFSHVERTQNRTPLISVAKGKLENVKLLIEAGADPHYVYTSKNGFKESALHSALLMKKIEIVNYLIFDIGIDYRIVNGYFKSGEEYTIANDLRRMTFSLDSEKYKQKMKLVRYLQERGIDYWSAKIPKIYYSNYDSAYLLKY